MQSSMTFEPCCRCGQPIEPGKPAMHTASVDLDAFGRVGSSPVTAYHLSGDCYDEYRRSRGLPIAA